MEARLSGVFWKLMDALRQRPRYISQRGGTRSGKTYSTLQLLDQLIPRADKAGDVTSVVSETLPHLKRGAIRDFEKIIGHPLSLDPNWNATDLTYTYPNGAKLEFFSADNPGKVQGPARKRLFINECNHVSWEVFLQLDVRTTSIVLLDYNPCETFWAIEKVETRPNCVTIVTTYLDNLAFLTPAQVQAIEANKDNRQWWEVYGEGKIGHLEGAIYDFDLVDAMPEGLTEVYGLDFGFTNDPTALVHIAADTGRREAWVRQVIYDTHLLNRDIIARMDAAGVSKRGVEIFADCAEPKSIEDIYQAGYNIKPCDKDAPVRSEKLRFQLQWMQGWRLHFTKDSLDLIKEGRNYIWARDKNGNPLNYPIDDFNHALDALRYGLWTKFGSGASQGTYFFV